MTPTGDLPSVEMSNVLSEEKKQQVIALGRLGWSLRRIQRATGVRRETAGDYLRAAGIEPRPPGRWGRQAPAKPANRVTPDPDSGSKPANEVTPDSGAPLVPVPEPAPAPGRSPTASACEPYREVIEAGLGKGRNAKSIWQDLVDDHGFRGSYQSVKRFVGKLRGSRSPEARVVIETPPGEETQVDYGTGPMVRDPASGRYQPYAAVRPDARLQPQVGTPAHLPVQHAASGSNCMSGPSAGWAGSLAWWCSTTWAKACSPRTSTIPR